MVVVPGWVDRWAVLYADTPVASTTIVASHVLAMFVGGGVALATDLALWHGAGEGLVQWRRVRRIVDLAVGVVFVTGVVLFLTDVATFIASPVYWIKMAAFALLVANGLRFAALDRAASTPAVANAVTATTIDAAPARRARSVAATSACLWCLTVVLGVIVAST